MNRNNPVLSAENEQVDKRINEKANEILIVEKNPECYNIVNTI